MVVYLSIIVHSVTDRPTDRMAEASERAGIDVEIGLGRGRFFFFFSFGVTATATAEPKLLASSGRDGWVDGWLALYILYIRMYIFII